RLIDLAVPERHEDELLENLEVLGLDADRSRQLRHLAAQLGAVDDADGRLDEGEDLTLADDAAQYRQALGRRLDASSDARFDPAMGSRIGDDPSRQLHRRRNDGGDKALGPHIEQALEGFRYEERAVRAALAAIIDEIGKQTGIDGLDRSRS